MSKFALVFTVDTMGANFPSHCVRLFENEDAAYEWAAQCIDRHDPTVWFDHEVCRWVCKRTRWPTAKQCVEAWQEGLDCTECFHVLPVADGESQDDACNKYGRCMSCDELKVKYDELREAASAFANEPMDRTTYTLDHKKRKTLRDVLTR